MNKRTWTWIVVGFLLFDAILFGALGWWFFLRKPAAASKVFQILPESTVALFYLPDASASKLRWQETSLFKIWSEPSIQSLVAKPISSFREHKASLLLERIIASPGIQDTFVSILSISPEPVFLIGMRVTADAVETDNALAAVESALKDRVAGESGMETHGKQILRSYTVSGQKLMATTFGEWRFWSNQSAAILNAIESIESTDNDRKSIKNSPSFKSVTNIVSLPYEALAFIDFIPLQEVLLGIAASASTSEDLGKSIRSVNAVGLSVGFEGLQIREDLRIAFAEKSPGSSPILTGEGLRFTTPDTLIFYESVFSDFPLLNLEELDKIAAQSPAFDPLKTFTANLRERGVSSESLARTFGPEISFQLDWASGMMQPRLYFRAGVRDRDEASKILDVVTGGAMGAPWKKRDLKTPETAIFSMPIQAALMQPVLSVGLNKNSLVLGTSGRDVENFFKRPEPGGKNIESNPGFAAARERVGAKGSSFMFADSKLLFGQVYGSVKSAISVMNMFSGSSQALPVNKLPATEEIARHLQPFSMSTRMEGNVLHINSTGPLAFSGTIVVVALGATGAAYGQGMLGDRISMPPESDASVKDSPQQPE